MIIFRTLTIRNFMSYGNNVTTFAFDKPGTTLIVGEDLDNTAEGQGSNGVGKTTFLNALVYALYDRVLSEDVTKDGLVNNINKKEMQVTLTFTADDGNTYLIVRERKMKSGADGNTTTLYRVSTDESGNVTREDLSVDSKGTNKKIEEILNMSYDMFVRIVVFSASNDSFLRLPASSTSGPNQRDFIEDLFGLNILTQKAEKLKTVIKDTKSELEIKKAQIDALEGEKQRYADQIANAERRITNWELQRASAISDMEHTVTSIEGVDIEGQRLIHAQAGKVATSLTQASQEQRELKRNCKEHVSLVSKLNSELDVLYDNKCPHCKQSYEGAKAEIVTKGAELARLEAELEQLYTQLTEQNEIIEELNQLHQQLLSQLTVDNIEELVKIQSNMDNIKARIEEMKYERNPHTDVLEDLKAQPPAAISYDDVNRIQRELDHQNFLLKLLTRSDSFVRKALLNNYLPFLNNRIQFYLQMLGLPHVVEFQEDLTAKITHMGVEIKFGNLSTGQKARVDFAFSVAFKDVREKLHGRTNVCMFDEVLDFGMDAVGVMSCAKVIKYIARVSDSSVYVISHRNEIDSVFDRKLTIQMIKKFSYVKEN